MSKTALLKDIWSRNRGLFSAIAALVLLSVALFFYQTLVADPESKRLQARQRVLQQQLMDREAKLAQSGVPVSTVEQMERDLLKFSELIPEKDEFADFIGDLFSWAGQTNLDIRQISYEPKLDTEANFLTYSLSFSVDGTYGQMKKFIHFLENSRRILLIDKISLTGRRSKDNSSIVSLQINLTTYFQEVAR